MNNFAVIRVAGYIAPRHLQAIGYANNRIVAAVDPHDSVGILDQYSTEISCFTEFECFERHLEKLGRGTESEHVLYISIYFPNYLHDARCCRTLGVGADAICEIVLIINLWNVDALSKIQLETSKQINVVVQLRVHPALVALREKLRAQEPQKHKHDVVLTYTTSWDKWYHHTRKGNISKSGGIATNIGIHFFSS